MQHLDPKLRDEIDSKFRLARILLDSGDTEQAIKLSEDAWDLLPDPKFEWDVSKSYTHAMAVRYRDAKKYDEAIRLMKSLFESNTVKPYQDEPYFIMGTIFYEKGDLDEARRWLKKANEISNGRCFQGEPEKYKNLIY